MSEGPFFSETQKIRPRIEKYLTGRSMIVDYGCGQDKIFPTAIGIDLRAMPGVDHVLKNIYDVYQFGHRKGWQDKVDIIYSSHFLEHIDNDAFMVTVWTDLLKPGGYLILYLPDDDYYDNQSNPEHLHWYKHKNFVREFMGNFKDDLRVVDSGPDVGDDRYSFFVVAERLK